MYFKGTYSCGYCGCDNIYYFKANSIDDVCVYMVEGLYDYAGDYIDVEYPEGYTDDDFDNFLYDCGFDVEEITDMDDLEGEDIIDLTM